jgi:quercetin dioxygenase-like cupin family protein
MNDSRDKIPAEPARRTPGHEHVAERLGRSVVHIDMAKEIELLRGEETYQRVGRNGKTLVKRADLRVVLIALRGGARIDEHVASGPLTVEAVRGRIRMRVPGGEVELTPGHLVALERSESHDVEALEDSAFLLTIAWPGPR